MIIPKFLQKIHTKSPFLNKISHPNNSTFDSMAHASISGRACGTPGYILRMKRLPGVSNLLENCIPIAHCTLHIAHASISGRACGTPGYILRMKRLPGVSILLENCIPIAHCTFKIIPNSEFRIPNSNYCTLHIQNNSEFRIPNSNYCTLHIQNNSEFRIPNSEFKLLLNTNWF